jgi:hypothetical protein
MDPQIHLASVTCIDWPTFRSVINKVFGKQPDAIVQCPVPLFEDQEYLLYLAWLSGIDISNPAGVLRHLPFNLLEYIHYTFMIWCDASLSYEFRNCSNLSMIMVNARDAQLILATGTLDMWFSMLTLNLTREKISSQMRLLCDKFLLVFEKRGLQDLFAQYQKISQNDSTFLLEYKK